MLCIIAYPRKYMRRMQEYFKIKYDKAVDIYMYIGATLYKMLLEVSKTLWTIFVEKYVKSEVTNVEESLARYGRRLP